jgi:hypothetical protein
MPEQITDGLEWILCTQQVDCIRVSECMGSAPTFDLDSGLSQPPLNHRTET